MNSKIDSLIKKSQFKLSFAFEWLSRISRAEGNKWAFALEHEHEHLNLTAATIKCSDFLALEEFVICELWHYIPEKLVPFIESEGNKCAIWMIAIYCVVSVWLFGHKFPFLLLIRVLFHFGCRTKAEQQKNQPSNWNKTFASNGAEMIVAIFINGMCTWAKAQHCILRAKRPTFVQSPYRFFFYDSHERMLWALELIKSISFFVMWWHFYIVLFFFRIVCAWIWSDPVFFRSHQNRNNILVESSSIKWQSNHINCLGAHRRFRSSSFNFSSCIHRNVIKANIIKHYTHSNLNAITIWFLCAFLLSFIACMWL